MYFHRIVINSNYYFGFQQLGKIRGLLNNGSRQNLSRELVLPKSVDIAKVISDDATGDEKGLEELPEASVKKFVVFLTVKFLILSTRICNKKKI